MKDRLRRHSAQCRQRLNQSFSAQSEKIMALDERIEVHWIEIRSLWIGEARHVAGLNLLRQPLDKASALGWATALPAALGDLTQTGKALASDRVQDGVADP